MEKTYHVNINKTSEEYLFVYTGHGEVADGFIKVLDELSRGCEWELLPVSDVVSLTEQHYNGVLDLLNEGYDQSAVEDYLRDDCKMRFIEAPFHCSHCCSTACRQVGEDEYVCADCGK